MNPSTELLERCRHDDRKAHHELYVMCFPVMYSVCSRYYVNKEDSMASLNMVFLKLIKGMTDYLRKHNHIPFEQWMRRVNINYIIDEFRKQKKYRELVSQHDDMPDEQYAIAAAADEKYDSEEILMAIEQLSPMSRTVLNLYAIDGYKHEEIANLLGISSGTSKAHLFKARKKLQEMLIGLKNNSQWNKSIVQ
ncbi:MAG: sigma-70 family RNA polymerase sigma factor [Bacteroidia bacterium]